MKRSDISDKAVVQSYEEAKGKVGVYPYDILMEKFECCCKVALRAMERASDRGYVDYGVSLRSGFVTAKGRLLVDRRFTEG